LPFEILGYGDIPAYISSRTYCIIANASGHNEVVASALLQQVMARGGHVHLIAGGGDLATTAQHKQLPITHLPTASLPYYTLLGSLTAIVDILHGAGLLANDSAHQQLRAAGVCMTAEVQAWLPTVPTAKNPAKQLALDMLGKSVVIYSGSRLWPAANRWKAGFNEQAKQIAWTNQATGLTVGEILGWTDQPVNKPYAIIELRSALEGHETQKRFAASERVLSGLRPSPHVVKAVGDTLIMQLLWLIGLGDFSTAYAALAHGTDPARSNVTDKFYKLVKE